MPGLRGTPAGIRTTCNALCIKILHCSNMNRHSCFLTAVQSLRKVVASVPSHFAICRAMAEIKCDSCSIKQRILTVVFRTPRRGILTRSYWRDIITSQVGYTGIQFEQQRERLLEDRTVIKK